MSYVILTHGGAASPRAVSDDCIGKSGHAVALNRDMARAELTG